MIGFVLGLLFGGAIAGGSFYAIYLFNHAEKASAAQAKAVSGRAAVPARSRPQPEHPPSGPPPSSAAASGDGDKQKALMASEQPTNAAPSPNNVATQSQWLGEMSQRIEGEIGSHSFRIEEISASLRSAREGEPDMVLDAASRIMLANQQLQAELAAARAEIDEHRAKVKELSEEARTDILTGLANRRAFTEDLERRFEQWRRHKVPLSLIMLDIDHFKSINDRFTHAGGDTALRHIGEVLRGALRQMDIAARYGGEEFALILPGTKLPDAINVAERLRATIAAKGFEYDDLVVPITGSLGLATADASDTAATLIERADQALYAAKQGGRNRAYVHDGDVHVPIEADKALVRHPFRDLQHIAPYKLGGELPTAADFFPVQCYDLSTKGISFLASSPPDFQALIIRLGNPPSARYMISSIANVAPMMVGDEKQYRVGCTFVSRLDPEEISPSTADEAAPSEPQFVGA
ncbi:MAG TPA: GGDEF domain-containing protein [Pirellulales bacterium]|nr:GGDEF domain-containing protein [Pirellulales bacterium]